MSVNPKSEDLVVTLLHYQWKEMRQILKTEHFCSMGSPSGL